MIWTLSFYTYLYYIVWMIYTDNSWYIHSYNKLMGNRKKLKCITKSILPMYEQLVWFTLKVQSWLLFYNVMNRIDSEKQPVLLIILKLNWSSTLFIPHLHWIISLVTQYLFVCLFILSRRSPSVIFDHHVFILGFNMHTFSSILILLYFSVSKYVSAIFYCHLSIIKSSS